VRFAKILETREIFTLSFFGHHLSGCAHTRFPFSASLMCMGRLLVLCLELPTKKFPEVFFCFP
jgi:hypothetical protein